MQVPRGSWEDACDQGLPREQENKSVELSNVPEPSLTMTTTVMTTERGRSQALHAGVNHQLSPALLRLAGKTLGGIFHAVGRSLR